MLSLLVEYCLGSIALKSSIPRNMKWIQITVLWLVYFASDHHKVCPYTIGSLSVFTVFTDYDIAVNCLNILMEFHDTKESTISNMLAYFDNEDVIVLRCMRVILVRIFNWLFLMAINKQTTSDIFCTQIPSFVGYMNVWKYHSKLLSHGEGLWETWQENGFIAINTGLVLSMSWFFLIEFPLT